MNESKCRMIYCQWTAGYSEQYELKFSWEKKHMIERPNPHFLLWLDSPPRKGIEK